MSTSGLTLADSSSLVQLIATLTTQYEAYVAWLTLECRGWTVDAHGRATVRSVHFTHRRNVRTSYLTRNSRLLFITCVLSASCQVAVLIDTIGRGDQRALALVRSWLTEVEALGLSIHANPQLPFHSRQWRAI